MKVILLGDIKGVGKKDQVIEASDGYARNFLFPKKLAVEANNENMSKLKSKILLNIDSEDENVIIVSCAGGMAFENRIKFARVESKLENPIPCKLEISGLKGGHSGSDRR